MDSLNKVRTFEYAVIKMAEWSIELNGYANFNEFNLNNDFTRDKILTFPFFLCTANGKREIMFRKVFDQFYTGEYGYVEKEVRDNMNQLKLFQSEKNFIIFNNTFLTANGHSKKVEPTWLINQIPIDVVGINLEGMGTIYILIDYLIEKIKKRDPSFVDHNIEIIKYLSREHSSWRFNRFLIEKGIIPAETIVESTPLITENSPYSLI